MQTITMTSKKNLLSLSYWSKNTVVCNLILSCTSIDTCQLIAVFFFLFFFFWELLNYIFSIAFNIVDRV